MPKPRSRRENLQRSADDLKIRLETATGLLAEAFEEMKKIELLDERDQMRERVEENAREQAELDAIGLMRSSAPGLKAPGKLNSGRPGVDGSPLGPPAPIAGPWRVGLPIAGRSSHKMSPARARPVQFIALRSVRRR